MTKYEDFEQEWTRAGWGDAADKKQCEHFFQAGRESMRADILKAFLAVERDEFYEDIVKEIP